MTVRWHPRDIIVRRAELEIRDQLSATLNILNLSWVDILYQVAMIKTILLAEMGATAGPGFYMDDIPDSQYVISAAFYGPMIEHDLTSAELYMIISEWEVREAWGMIKEERKGD